MARGDARIDFSTNDLLIEKSGGDIFVPNSWRYDSDKDIVYVSLELPRQYSDEFDETRDWRTHTPVCERFQAIDSIYDSKEVYIEYTYRNLADLSVAIDSFPATQKGIGSEVIYMTVVEWNILLDSIVGNKKSLIFDYREYYVSTDVETIENKVIFVRDLILGDFVIEDNITQNEYLLLNANEGSFLQHPLQGVGIGSFIQSPSSDQSLINTVVEKFAQDTLRVIGIQKIEETLTVESEDFNIS